MPQSLPLPAGTNAARLTGSSVKSSAWRVSPLRDPELLLRPVRAPRVPLPASCEPSVGTSHPAVTRALCSDTNPV